MTTQSAPMYATVVRSYSFRRSSLAHHWSSWQCTLDGWDTLYLFHFKLAVVRFKESHIYFKVDIWPFSQTFIACHGIPKHLQICTSSPLKVFLNPSKFYLVAVSGSVNISTSISAFGHFEIDMAHFEIDLAHFESYYGQLEVKKV